MEGSDRQTRPLFFKEYTCYDFALPPNKAPHVNLKYFPEFSSLKSCSSSSVLPSAIIDHHSQRNQLYILQWKLKSKSSLLFIKELNSEDWVEIGINGIPQFTAISGGQLFIIIEKELFILSLYQQQHSRKQLTGDKIISVNPCLVQITSTSPLTSTSNYETGLSILYLSETKGYFKESYSVNSVNQPNSSLLLKNIFNLAFKNKMTKYSHVQVIIPNILGIVFTDHNKFRMFNLQQMKDYPQSECTLNFGSLQKDEKPVIRWRHHQKFADFDQTLLLLIGVGSNIELFFMNMKLKQKYAEQLLDQSLGDINDGDIINWESLQIISYISFVIEGNILVDVVISKKGVTYHSKNSQNSEIGYFRSIDLSKFFSEIPILNQEAILWRSYYEDKQLSKTQANFNTDKYYVPNRYPKQLILQQQKEALERKGLNILNEWRSSYAFRGILCFEEDILIVRASSISIFRQITESLYKFEYFSEQQHEAIQTYQLSNRQEQDDIEQLWNFNLDDFQEPPFHTALHRTLLEQRKYFVHEQQLLMEEIQNRQIANVFDQLNQIVSGHHQAIYSSMKVSPFIQALTSNQLKDKINYFNLILNKKSWEMEDERQRQNCKEYERSVFIIDVVNYFYTLLQQSKEWYDLFGNNPIDMFIQSCSQKLTADIDVSISILLQLLFKNIFPKAITNYQNSIIYTDVNFQGMPFNNAFFDFLLQQFIQIFDQSDTNEDNLRKKEEKKLRMLRNEFSKIIRLGFMENKSIYFSQFWTNVSIYKLLLLSNESDLLKKYLSQYAIYKHSEETLKHYLKLKKYILKQNVYIVQTQILINQHYYKIPFNLNFIRQSGKDGFNEITEKQYWPTIFLQYHNNTADIQRAFDQWKKDYSSLQTYKQFLETIAQTKVHEDEENLQLYQILLRQFVEAFNYIVTDHATHLEDTQNGNQTDREPSKQIVCGIFNQIKKYFYKYKQLFQTIYQRQAEDSTSFQQQLQQDQQLMASSLLERKTIALLANQQSTGIVCSTLSLNLIGLALAPPTIQTNDSAQQILPSLLKRKSDLVCFWMNQLPNFCHPQRALYLDLIFKLGKQQMQEYLRIDNEAKQEIRLYSQQCRREGKNYQFYSLLQQVGPAT